jgi:hypothetical protein
VVGSRWWVVGGSRGEVMDFGLWGYGLLGYR